MKRLATIFTDADYVLQDQGAEAASTYLINQADKLKIDRMEFLRLYLDYKGLTFIGGTK